jgi:hypothetical protein
MFKSSLFYRFLTFLNFAFNIYVDIFFLKLPISLFTFTVLISITLLSIFLFFEALTFCLEISSNKIKISSYFYEKEYSLKDIKDFKINFLRGKIKFKDRVISFPPIRRGNLRKVEELL